MILVDSDVLIAHLRGLDVATEWLLDVRAHGPLAISVVTVTEITGGIRSHERREVWSLLAAFRKESIDDLVARSAGRLMRTYRRSHRSIGITDYLIAATAFEHGLELATLNVKHFPMFPGLRPPFVMSG